jgi:hypothetical protein
MGKINFFLLLGIVFIILKLCGVIMWSWVWVLAPIWAPSLLGLIMLMLLLSGKFKIKP